MAEISQPEVDGETSKAGARRMKRLAADLNSLRPSQSCAIHPVSGDMIYPAPSSLNIHGHLIAPVSRSAPPRPLPTPTMMTPSQKLWLSPGGEWVIIYHPNPMGEGGTLAVYHETILSPLSTPTTVPNTCFATLQLDKPPIELLPLYSSPLNPRCTRSMGPRPPLSYETSQGPAFLVLTHTGILLAHPQLMPTQPLDMNSLTAMNGGSVPMRWGLNLLKCPLNMSWLSANGELPPPENGYRIDNGWIGVVNNNESVWVGTEREGEVGVVKVDIGQDRSNRWYLQSTLLPGTPSSGGQEQDMSEKLQGIIFTPLPGSQLAETDRSEDGDGVGVVTIRGTINASGQTRTTVETWKYIRHKVELSASFSELSGQNETPESWEYSPSLQPISQCKLSETSVVALQPLPHISPYSLAMALLSKPSGLSLAYVDLTAKSTSEDPAPRFAMGEETELRKIGDACVSEMILSCGVQRGLRGLVGVVGVGGITLVVPPSLNPKGEHNNASAGSEDETLRQCAQNTADAMKQGTYWSDAFRAIMETAPHGTSRQTFYDDLSAILSQSIDLDPVDTLFRVKIADFSMTNDTGYLEAFTVISRLHQASQLFAASASFGDDGHISFDLNCVWPLVTVSEWCYTAIAALMRDFILERAKVEQNDSTSSVFKCAVLALPSGREMILRLLSQLRAFASFVLSLDQPISQPETRSMPMGMSRDPRATVLAKDRVSALAQRDGLEVEVWGKALQEIHNQIGTNASKQDHLKAIIDLTSETIIESINGELSSLPAPSSLFMYDPISTSSENEQTYDAITFLPISPGIGIKCDTCHSRTVAMDASIQQGLLSRNGRSDAWEEWRRARARGCWCGGNWVRK